MTSRACAQQSGTGTNLVPKHGRPSPRTVPFRSGPASRCLTSRHHLSKTAPDFTKSGGVDVRSTRASALVTRASGSNPTPGKFDYILVGGGTAACVLANRLTADGTKNVLVLEAGGPHGSMDVKLPAGLPRLFKSMLDWNLYSTKQQPVDERQVYMARGKLLGGSSCTNATLYHRGTAADYEAWGVRGWGSKEALEAMIANEDNGAGAVAGVHGSGGMMHVEQPRYHNRMHDMFFQACASAGIPQNPDFNDWSHPQAGYGEFQVFHDRGERADMYRQYLQPVMGRSNLTVLTNAKTLRVALEGKTARGVVYVIGGPDGVQREAELVGGGEVIMCAGAVHTPQILQLSGVGAAADLNRFDIPVVADIPGVGQNLQDHPAALVAYRTREELGPIALTDQLLRASGQVRARAVLAWALFRRGPLTTTGCDHGAFVSTTGAGEPDLQIRFVPGMALNPDGIGSYVDFGRRPAGSKWPSGFTFQLLACRAKSRGTIGLRSSDPFDAPLFNPGFLSNPADLATLREGVRLSRRLAAEPALAAITDSEFHPGADVASDADVDAYIRRTLHSGNAVVGSCKMGNPGAPGAVVDPELRVVGLSGLRIVDASVIPVIPGGQTGAAVVMIAERAARIMAAGSEDQQLSAPSIPAMPALA